MNAVVVRETLRRHVTHAGYITYVIFVALVGLGAAGFAKPATMWPTLVSLLAIIAGAGVIGPEFSSGTLQLVLVKPVNRAVYLLSRVTGVVLAVWIVACAGALAELIGRAIWTRPAYEWIGGTLLNAMTDVILTVALLALLGSLTRAYFNAAIYVALMIGLSVATGIAAMLRATHNAVGQFLERVPQLEEGLRLVDLNLFPDVGPRLAALWSVTVLANAALALVLACFAFRNREVPYGAD
jgi:ABC-type transport system involved in multi-copper enzyme maturation permease subunit